MTVENPSAQKSLHLFTEVFDFKKKTAVLQVGAIKLKQKEIRKISMLWSNIKNIRRHTKSMNRIKNLFIIGIYNILRLRSTQLPIISLKFLLTVTLNHSWFQNGYFKCLYGNFIIPW